MIPNTPAPMFKLINAATQNKPQSEPTIYHLISLARTTPKTQVLSYMQLRKPYVRTS